MLVKTSSVYNLCFFVIYRLHAAEILLIGIKGLGAEVCKNLVLAGIKSLTILDSGLVTEEDSCYQFLAPVEPIGKNVSIAVCQVLSIIGVF